MFTQWISSKKFTTKPIKVIDNVTKKSVNLKRDRNVTVCRELGIIELKKKIKQLEEN